MLNRRSAPPFCSRHATQALPQIVEEYVDSGKLRIVMREYPIEAIHPRAFAASKAAMCAGAQGKYWEMHDKIFANQRSLSDEDFTSHANLLELDTTAYDTCLTDQAISKQIDAEIQEAFSELKQKLPKFKTPRFTRTVSQWFNLLVETGFVIQQVEEPRPSDDTVQECSDMQDAQIVAYFLHVRARIPTANKTTGGDA